MISLTSTDHGLASGARHGRSRACAEYQARTGSACGDVMRSIIPGAATGPPASQAAYSSHAMEAESSSFGPVGGPERLLAAAVLHPWRRPDGAGGARVAVHRQGAVGRPAGGRWLVHGRAPGGRDAPGGGVR